MRNTLLCLLVSMLPLSSGAGAISRQFGQGYDGISWGDSLADLVARRPGGQHHFAVGIGHREYDVPDEKTMFGISRTGMRVHYFFDETGSVVSAGLTIPYESREKLLGALTLSFGPYQQVLTKDISTLYVWTRDDGTGIFLRATLDPAFGILELGLDGPNSVLDKQIAGCDKQPMSEKGKK